MGVSIGIPPLSVPHKGRVIITYGRSLMALVIARSLAKRGIEVIGCDDVNLTVLSFSKHVKETFTVAPWQSDPEQFLQDLEVAVRDYAPRDGRPYVLMPVFREIELIAQHRERFEPLIQLAAPAYQSIARVNPKHHLAALAAQTLLDAPQTWVAEDAETLAGIAADADYPVIVKPADGAGGRGVCIAKSAEEVVACGGELGFDLPTLVQELVPGDDYCVAVLAKHGALTAIMAYRNLSTFPRTAGAGAARETVDAEPFRATAERLVAATNWNGVAQLDFRWSGDAADTPSLIEVNARFWAGIFHSVETGTDFPWLLYRQTIGLDAEQQEEPQIGARTKSPLVWLLAAVQDVAASDAHFSAAGDAWRTVRRDLKHGKLVKAIEDAGGALSETFSISDAISQLKTDLSDLKGAPSELTADDDPIVGLGALFVLSSLVRHGKLPPEITYKSMDAPPAEPKRERPSRPVIGITTPNRGDTLAYLAMKFAVWLAGGAPVRITAAAPWDPHTIDGLIFGAGTDVYPERYEGKPKPGYRYDLARGEMEASWAIAARRYDLPVLGVCRGAQMLNVLAGGTLHADLSPFGDARSPTSVWGRMIHRKPVRVTPQSRLAALIGAGPIHVNAIHDQAIDRVGAGLSVAAREPSGVVQAVEDKLRRFWIGVQFHPELLVYRRRFRRLFTALIDAANVRAAERLASDAAISGVTEPAPDLAPAPEPANT